MTDILDNYSCSYYLKCDWHEKETEVTEQEYIKAERLAGFFSKTGEGCATGSFGSGGISGRVEYKKIKSSESTNGINK